MNNPFIFYNKTLRYEPLKYNLVDKYDYSPEQVLKDLWVCILHSHIIAHVPTNAVKDILTQPDPKGRRGKWIIVLHEYDLDIKPMKLIKG